MTCRRAVSLKHQIQSILGKFGYRLARADTPAGGLNYFFLLLKQLDFHPRHIIDVGANHGIWTRTAIKYFPDALYTLLEPQDNLKVHIQDLLDAGYKIRWINAGASDQPGILPFTISKRDDSSSFALTEEQAQSAGYQRVAINLKTLNEIASSTSDPPPDMVKIDAEGFDLKVLAGASDLFGKTEIFLVEVGICFGYENTLLEVTKRMASVGYRPLDITDFNRSPKDGLLALAEVAFIRNESPLLAGVNSYE